MNLKTFIAVSMIILLGYFGYTYYQKLDKNTEVSSSDTYYATPDNYVGSEYKGNYVWGGAMNLAWNDLSENIVKDTIQFRSQDKTVQSIAQKFNSKPFTKEDLDEKSYYIQSGFGQETVSKINTESSEKFPEKSFGDLNIQLASEDIIAYAYFLKQVEYQVEFTEDLVPFKEAQVKGFSAKNAEQRSNITILEYIDDDTFILSFSLKDSEDQLIVAKGYDMTKPAEIVKKINTSSDTISMAPQDVFKMPNLHFEHSRQYKELLGQGLKNMINGNDGYVIDQMFENIKFDLDHKGARVENEAVIGVIALGAINSPSDPKNLILDKPFWVVMKRTNSQNPYFILGVNNTELLSVEK